MVESDGPGQERNVEVLDTEVRRGIDLEFLGKATAWMEECQSAGEPFFLYFNHANVHSPVMPRAETSP